MALGFRPEPFFLYIRVMLQDFRLKVFMTVAQEKSFTRAARRLEVSQPAVSQHITELEKSVGAPLFERGRGDVALTEKGRTFQMFAARILKDYEDLNHVFDDYEAFAEIMRTAQAVSDSPYSELVKDILYR